MVGDLTEISVGFQRNKNETPQLPRIDVGKNIYIFFGGGGGWVHHVWTIWYIILLRGLGLRNCPTCF